MSDDAMKALDEIVDVLCKHLGPQVLNQDVASDIDIDRHDDFRSDMQEVAADILALPTLRAALAPGADGEVEAIRGRHEEYAAVWNFGDQVKQDYQYLEDAHNDRATLLRALDAERARRVEVEGALDHLFDTEAAHSRTTPAIIDVAFTAFMRAKDKNDEDGGPTDWMTDTRPMIVESLGKLRATLTKETP